MKRMLSLLLSTIIVCSVAFATVAETDIEKGELAIHETIKYVFGTGDYDTMFESGSFATRITDKGEIVVMANATWRVGQFAQDDPSTAGMISVVWDMFASASREFTTADIYFLVDYEGDTIYMAWPDGVFDARYEKVYEHITL